MVKTLNIVSGGLYRDYRLTDSITLLFKDIILPSFPMQMIDTHLKCIVQTRMLSHQKSGNLEDLWEDLIFMNSILSFKLILARSKETTNVESLIRLNYGEQLPNAELLSLLILKCIEVHKKVQEVLKVKEAPKQPMRDTISICCLHLLFKVSA